MKLGLVLLAFFLIPIFGYVMSALESSQVQSASKIQSTSKHPGSVYLFEIRGFDGFKFLKVGFSTNVRSRDFKLNGSKRLLDVIHFSSSKEAFDYEQSIHEYLMDHQLPTRLAKRYLQNGWTECYYHGTINQLPRS